MADAYKITFQKGAIADLKAIDKPTRTRILERLSLRLALSPRTYGVPLRYEFAGLYKLRVGDYRVVYVVEGLLVDIVVVGHRRDVYPKLKRRI